MDRKQILEAAEKAVCGDRNHKYGEPEDNFTAIADAWTHYLGYPISAADVALMMILFKVARQKTGSDIDNFVDIAGYAACGGEVIDKKPK